MRVIYFLMMFLTGCLWIRPVLGALSVIRDTETEELLLNYVQPIFKAANLNPENAKVIVINDPSINAFVAGGQTIFIHTGLFLKAGTPDEIMFVLSHETGHIVGGHVVRGYQALQNAQTTALISTVLGGVLAVAGGRPDAGVAVMMGGQSSAMGMFTKYRQTEESAADRTAVDILKKTGYSMTGFERIMKAIKSSERLNNTSEGSYLRTHPLTQTRVEELKHYLDHPLPLHHELAFDLVKAKLSGFLETPDKVLQTYSDETLPSRYARTIAFYRKNDFKKAFELLDGLIAESQDNPYFYELKGQLLFETGRLDEAAKVYAEANRLKKAPLIQLSYAHVLLELGGEDNAASAEKLLKSVTENEPDSSLVWQLLAKAYDRQGKTLEADYATVESERAAGRLPQAQKRAKRIIDEFPENLAIHQRLHDILDLGREE